MRSSGRNSSTGRGWEGTEIWEELQADRAYSERVRDALKACMPQVELVLDHAATSPSDFTLHDAEHSYRVANRLAQLMPATTLARLSAFELGLLLLAAYTHDIGMTPDQGLIRAHYEYALVGDASGLGPHDFEVFQAWLDERAPNLGDRPVGRAPTAAKMRETAELVAQFARDRHVEWSDSWIVANLSGIDFGYSSWLTDLRLLCRSHQEGFSRLTSDDFDPRLVAEGALVNLRYLAALLRVGDVLDVDPERTPSVIYRHRDVSPSSAIYWAKDHEIALDASADHVRITSRTPTARLHRAVELTADQVDAQLRVCRDLADRGLLRGLPGPEADAYEWALPPKSSRDLRPQPNTYEYVHGAFRPDTDQLLTLLGGVNLYQEPLAAVRELLQNAADAVAEQIAWERVRSSNPLDPSREDALRIAHAIELRLEIVDDEVWLVCRDDGVGMTKLVITDHLLVSGASRRKDIAELERKAHEAGFDLDRTGRFGIGVLSYFMIADRVDFQTRRSPESGTSESCGWWFSTEGVGSWGELRRSNTAMAGTETRLRLRPEVVGTDVASVSIDLERYLRSTLAHVPCTVRFWGDASERPRLELAPGWTRTPDDLAHLYLAEFRSLSTRHPGERVDLLSASQQRKREDERTSQVQTANEIRTALRWHHREGVLPDGLGAYRISVPFFDLSPGRSLAYMRFKETGDRKYLEPTAGGDVYLPYTRLVLSWHGMRVLMPRDAQRLLPARRTGAIIEVDWRSDRAGDLAVSRMELALSAEAIAVGEAVTDLAYGEVRSIAVDSADSLYASVNEAVAEAFVVGVRDAYWPGPVDEAGAAPWQTIQPPAVSESLFARLRVTTPLHINGGDVTFVRSLTDAVEGGEFPALGWVPQTVGPDRILMQDLDGGRVTALWETDRAEDPAHPAGLSAAFPPEWDTLAGVSISHYGGALVVWNQNHPVVTACVSSSWEWCHRYLPKSLDPVAVADDLILDRGRCAGWLLLMLTEDANELWESLPERAPGLQDRVWDMLFHTTADSPGAGFIHFWYEMGSSSLLTRLTRDSWEELDFEKEREAIEAALPPPQEEWRLRFR